MVVDIQKIIDYFLSRLKEQFTGKLIITFDKGCIVNCERYIKDDIEQFKTYSETPRRRETGISQVS